MKYKLLIIGIAVITAILYLSPAKYETVGTTFGKVKINADKLMKSGDYYFMCIPIQGYLIKKQKPELNIENKTIELKAIFDEGKAIINEHIDNNMSWYQDFEYRQTFLMDTNRMSSDLYVKDLGSKFLVAISHRDSISLLSPIEKAKYIGVKKEDYGPVEYILPYDDLVQLAKKRCKALGIEE